VFDIIIKCQLLTSNLYLKSEIPIITALDMQSLPK